MAKTPVVLCILDGWGIGPTPAANAPALARTPVMDALMASCPMATLTTFGASVGLPEGQMGNSEVGHLNIGAGRIVEMDLARINGVMARGEFAAQPVVQELIGQMQGKTGALHIFGVLSDGGVHAHLDHMIGAMQAFEAAGIAMHLHLFTDGRDVAPSSALRYLDALEAALSPRARIATVSGRYYAMDRDNRWERVARAYGAMHKGAGEAHATARGAIEAAYAQGITDEFIPPAVIGDYSGFSEGDAGLFLNFRADRAREILNALCLPEFDAFEIDARVRLAPMAGFTAYSDALNAIMPVVFPEEPLRNTLGEYVAATGRTQFRIAETEKYPHVTFFLNGGRETPFEGETRYLAPSPKVATYDLAPQMSAGEVTANLVAALRSGAYDLLVVNYANPDMVGHTGDLGAAITAVEAVDAGLGKVVEALEAAGGQMLICADHGNCEQMIDPATGGPHTAHTLNPVPAILIGAPEGMRLASGGRLCDLAPTLLELMGLMQPQEMTGESLLVSAQ